MSLSCNLTEPAKYNTGTSMLSLLLLVVVGLRVFENRVLRRIFGPKRDKVTGGRRKPYNEKFHYLYSAPSIIRTLKSRRMRWARFW
jgi:hypothetical protein